jgi:predicted ATP-dependent endonuclease of OLD family
MIKRLYLKNFTAFDEIDIEFSPGINLLIGDNGTGKTHLLKVMYSLSLPVKQETNISDNLRRNFLPDSQHFNQLRNVSQSDENTDIRLAYDDDALILEISSGITNIKGTVSKIRLIPIYISVYDDILNQVYSPIEGSSADYQRNLLKTIEGLFDGEVVVKGEKYFLRSDKGEIEFSLVAEGWRKLALLWLLLRNGSLGKGAILFWDHPETNLNPSMLEIVAKILLELQRNGVQIFLATHSYILLREFDLQSKEGDEVSFIHLFREEGTLRIIHKQSDKFHDIIPNKIMDAYESIYNKEIERSMGGVDI